jgi:NAD(P)-dependent dehydrogenase (short-subunit alcohol dehydrogenase family)
MATTKVALITASSAGLGAQIARAFAPDFRVVCLSNIQLLKNPLQGLQITN